MMKKTILGAGLVLSLCSSAWAGSADAAVEKILEEYVKIHAGLIADSTAGVDAAAAAIQKLASDTRSSEPETQKMLAAVGKAAQQIQGKELKEARLQFWELSQPLLDYVKQSYAGDKKYFRYHCSMAKKSWIQAAEGIRNPYYGSSMLTCGQALP